MFEQEPEEGSHTLLYSNRHCRSALILGTHSDVILSGQT